MLHDYSDFQTQFPTMYGHFDHTFIRYTRISDAWQIVISVKFTVKYHWKSEAQYEKNYLSV